MTLGLVDFVIHEKVCILYYIHTFPYILSHLTYTVPLFIESIGWRDVLTLLQLCQPQHGPHCLLPQLQLEAPPGCPHVQEK